MLLLLVVGCGTMVFGSGSSLGEAGLLLEGNDSGYNPCLMMLDGFILRRVCRINGVKGFFPLTLSIGFCRCFRTL